MADTVLKYWRISLALGLAVLTVVAALLETLVWTARQIQDGAAAIWQSGKLIANNTVHIPLLGRVNQQVAEISRSADQLAQAAARIQRAAAGGKGGER